MARLTVTSAELSVPAIGLCHVTSMPEAQKEAREHAKRGREVHIQPYHYSHTLTRLSYIPGLTLGNYHLTHGLQSN